MGTEFMGKRFADPVHDFLGEAAVASPDWEHLRECVGWFGEGGSYPGRMGNAAQSVRGDDWEYLGWVAGSHQLEGVVRWRLLDPRLVDLVPAERQEEARAVVAGLRVEGEQYREKARRALGLVEAAGIPYICASSPPAYALLGMTTWPRHWLDLDICIPSSRWREAKACLASYGVHEQGPAAEYLSLREGEAGERLPLEVLTWAPEHDVFEEGLLGWHRLFEEVRHYELGGISWPVPAPELWLWKMADGTYGAISWLARPLPLWALARLANVAALPDFSWDRLMSYMREWNLRTERQRAALDALPQQSLPNHKREPLFSAGSNVRVLLHVLRWVEEIYRGTVPAAFFAEAEVAFGAGPACLCTCEGDNFGEAPGRETFCEWDQAPSVETMLFEGYHLIGVQERIAAGWWKQAEPKEWASLGRPHWGREHLPHLQLPREAGA